MVRWPRCSCGGGCLRVCACSDCKGIIDALPHPRAATAAGAGVRLLHPPPNPKVREVVGPGQALAFGRGPQPVHPVAAHPRDRVRGLLRGPADAAQTRSNAGQPWRYGPRPCGSGAPVPRALCGPVALVFDVAVGESRRPCPTRPV